MKKAKKKTKMKKKQQNQRFFKKKSFLFTKKKPLFCFLKKWKIEKKRHYYWPSMTGWRLPQCQSHSATI